jgi:hypothetical protein
METQKQTSSDETEKTVQRGAAQTQPTAVKRRRSRLIEKWKTIS